MYFWCSFSSERSLFLFFLLHSATCWSLQLLTTRPAEVLWALLLLSANTFSQHCDTFSFKLADFNWQFAVFSQCLKCLALVFSCKNSSQISCCLFIRHVFFVKAELWCLLILSCDLWPVWTRLCFQGETPGPVTPDMWPGEWAFWGGDPRASAGTARPVGGFVEIACRCCFGGGGCAYLTAQNMSLSGSLLLGINVRSHTRFHFLCGRAAVRTLLNLHQFFSLCWNECLSTRWVDFSKTLVMDVDVLINNWIQDGHQSQQSTSIRLYQSYKSLARKTHKRVTQPELTVFLAVSN